MNTGTDPKPCCNQHTVQRPGEGEGGAVQGEQEAADGAQVRLQPAHEAVPRHREHDHRQEQGDHQPGDRLQGKYIQFIFWIIFSLVWTKTVLMKLGQIILDSLHC
jgi:hypothetical protein